MDDTNLYKALSRLSLKSLDAVQNGQGLTDFDNYMHVTRPIEEVLQQKMHMIDATGGGIVLLIGSAGDGKSHLLSLVKHEFDWPDQCYYNDATASCSPKIIIRKTKCSRSAKRNDIFAKRNVFVFSSL